MTIRVGINGFGRIGRNFWRAANAADGDRGIEIVAANDLGDIATMAHLLKYDSILGNLHHTITSGDDFISVDGKKLKVYAERDPAKLDWSSVGAQVVQDAAEQRGSVPAATPGRVDGDPQDLRPGGRFPGGYREARDRPGVGDDPGVVAGGVVLDLVGHILGEVVRKAPDDGRGGGSVPGLEWADGGHVIHGVSARRTLAIPFRRHRGCVKVRQGGNQDRSGSG